MRKAKDAPADDADAPPGALAEAPDEGAAPAAPAVDSEDDGEGDRTAADDEFIDDECVARKHLLRPPAQLTSASASHRDAAAPDSDGEEGVAFDPSTAPQAAEAEEGEDDIEALFKPKSSRRRAKDEEQMKELRSEAADLVAQMEVAAEQDAVSREAGALAVAKLRLLPEVERQLCRVDLQPLCLEVGLLNALSAWLRPGEDGSLPSLRVRTSLLALCARLPVDTREPDGREQLKRSGLGKVVMFYKLHDDSAGNRALAARLVDEWSRPIFALSATYRDMEREETELPQRRGAGKQQQRAALAQEDELDAQRDARLGPKDVRARMTRGVSAPCSD